MTSGESPTPLPAEPPRIELGPFLKRVGAVSTGGQAKVLIQGGSVTVNGATETRRRRKLVSGDRVTVPGRCYTVELD